MPKMNVPGANVKVWLPMPLYKKLSSESKRSGRPRAEIVREMLAERYEFQQPVDPNRVVERLAPVAG